MKKIVILFLFIWGNTVFADETCMSPYMAKIVGQEDYVYVWTLGQEGLGDGQDKLVTIDVKPGSTNYGKLSILYQLVAGEKPIILVSQMTEDSFGLLLWIQVKFLFLMSILILQNLNYQKRSMILFLKAVGL